MDYEIEIEGNSLKAGISRASQKGEEYNLKMSGEPSKKIFVIKSEGSKLVLSIENRMYSITGVRRSSGSVSFIMNGDLVVARIGGKKEILAASPEIANVSEIVISNFPAKVVKILASEGSKKAEGETLMIVEAMKMEAQIRSPKNCVVLEIFVKEGMMVPKGEKLARLKFI